MPRLSGSNAVAVIGLGRFGRAVASNLAALGTEVLAVERDSAIVAEMATVVTLAVEADGTDVDALRQLGIGDLRHVVVGMGTDLEASVLAVHAVAELGVQNIWAKAMTAAHKRILLAVGAHKVVLPEEEMGHRVAHLVTGRMTEYVDFDNGYAITMVEARPGQAGRTLGDLGLRRLYGVTVVGIQREDGRIDYTAADTLVTPGSRLVVAGAVADVERFAESD